MKTIRLLAFRGVGFRDPRYTDEDPLIKVGHVGFQLEGDPTIYGFHPTEEAIEEVGGLEATLNWLKARQILEGTIFDDSHIFHKAYALSQDNARITVFQIDHQVNEEEFDIIKAKVEDWITKRKTSPYRWPKPSPEPMPEEVDNCATFLRKLDIPIPERTGRMAFYMEAIQDRDDAATWDPKE